MGLMSVGGGTKIDLLWTNDAPSASFASQEIPLDLSAYSDVIIVYSIPTNVSQLVTGTGHASVFAEVGTVGCMLLSVSGNNGPGSGNRLFRVLKDKIQFSETRYSYGGNNHQMVNTACVPYKIYGVTK